MTSSIYLIGDVTGFVGDLADTLSTTSLDTLIVEAGNLAVDPITGTLVPDRPVFTYDEIREDLIDEGPDGENRTVIAYVNAAVTDHNRYYWNSDWVQGGPESNPDTGQVVNEFAEDWLDGGGLGVARGFGYIVDYRNQDWQQIVIDQSVAYIQQGYSGIFLDDVGRYDETSLSALEASRAMMQLVVNVHDAVIAATNMTADSLHLTINSDSYILANFLFDAAQQPRALTQEERQLVADFVNAVDGIVMENITADGEDYWGEAVNRFTGVVFDGFGNVITTGAETELTAIESPQDWDTMQSILAELSANGVNLFLSPDAGDYNTVLNAPIYGTSGNDTLTGTNLAEAIFGLTGADSIMAGGGDDIIYGGSEGSTIHGGDGNDLIYGGPGDDLIYAGAGDDTIYGGGGNDTIIGEDGADVIYGGDGNDILFGGTAPDDFVF